MTEPPATPPQTNIPGRRAAWLMALGLAAVTLGVFGQTFLNGHDYILFDDHLYVTENPAVLSGINAKSLRWVVTAVVAANWHPLTMLTHMLDIEMFGVEGVWGHHLVNVLWHTINVVLLFGLLRKMTGSFWCSALVAALFAWHPHRAESVAWVSERKDVLSGFFWMTTLWCYWYYVRRPTVWRYLPIGLSLALGLLSKPMLVTLPCVMLLLDFWPLARLQWSGWNSRLTWNCVGRLFAEKVPLFLIVVAVAVVTFSTQRDAAMASTEQISMAVRVSNAAMSYNQYIAQTIWPYPLFTPYAMESRRYNIPNTIFSGVGFLLVTVLAARGLRERPYLAVGWFWYLGTLVPVIGLVQVGEQSMADRYTYLPSIGLYIIVAWGLRELVTRNAALRLPVQAATGVVLVVMAGMCFFQVSLWKNTLTLFTHTVRHSPDDARGYAALGTGYQELGDRDRAIELYERALEMRPGLSSAWYNLGDALRTRNDSSRDDLKRAKEALVKSLETGHSPAKPHLLLGWLNLQEEDYANAYSHARQSALANPTSAVAYTLMALSAENLGKTEHALKLYEQSLQIDPTNWEVVHFLARLYVTAPDKNFRDPSRAVQLTRLADELHQHVTGQRDPVILTTMAAAYAELGDYDQAVEITSQALVLVETRADPTDPRTKQVAEIIRNQLRSYNQRLPQREELQSAPLRFE